MLQGEWMSGSAASLSNKSNSQSTVVLLEWNRSSMAVLLGENGELLRERELAAPIAGLAGEVEAVEDLVRSLICFANPHSVAARLLGVYLPAQKRMRRASWMSRASRAPVMRP